MASEILGLFGGKSPQQLQQDYLSNLSVSPGQMGSQGLLQQLISTGANAGTMMGYGAGRLLGGKVAGEVEASYLNEAIQAGQAGKTPAEKMKLVAAALEDKPGMGRQYMLALQEARKLEAEDFTMAAAKEKARTRTIKRQVDQFDPYTGKVIGQRSADITQVDSGRRDGSGNIIWEDLQQQNVTTQPPPAGGSGTPKSALDMEAERRANLKAGQTQGGATTTPVAEQALPQPRVLPPQNTQLTEAERLEQLYYDQQQAANPRSAPTPARPALPPLKFKTVEDQESAMRRAVAAGNRELAMRIRDAQVGTNR